MVDKHKFLDFFTCNCCAYAQDLTEDFLDGVKHLLPENQIENYIDCHCELYKPLTSDGGEFNLKHRGSVGCEKWLCGECGVQDGELYRHKGCWQ